MNHLAPPSPPSSCRATRTVFRSNIVVSWAQLPGWVFSVHPRTIRAILTLSPWYRSGFMIVLIFVLLPLLIFSSLFGNFFSIVRQTALTSSYDGVWSYSVFVDFFWGHTFVVQFGTIYIIIIVHFSSDFYRVRSFARSDVEVVRLLVRLATAFFVMTGCI